MFGFCRERMCYGSYYKKADARQSIQYCSRIFDRAVFQRNAFEVHRVHLGPQDKDADKRDAAQRLIQKTLGIHKLHSLHDDFAHIYTFTKSTKISREAISIQSAPMSTGL